MGPDTSYQQRHEEQSSDCPTSTDQNLLIFYTTRTRLQYQTKMHFEHFAVVPISQKKDKLERKGHIGERDQTQSTKSTKRLLQYPLHKR